MKKDLTKLMDLTKEDILKILNLADQMKHNLKHGKKEKLLKGKTLAMIFQKPSTRTRVSFEMGMYQLGGHALSLNYQDLQLGHGEPVEDTARSLSRYVDGIMIRASAQSEVEALANWSSIPVINGLTDYAHPCQVLADLMTIREYTNRLEEVRLAYIGSGNNVCNSLIVGGLTCGLKISAAIPQGYDPPPSVLDFAKKYPQNFNLVRSPRQAADKAEVLVTDIWGDVDKESFAEFQINRGLLNLADPKAIVLHCLPAKRGEEITADILEAHAGPIFDEAENLLHVQKAVMALLMG